MNITKEIFSGKDYPAAPAGLLKSVMGKVAAASLAQEGKKHIVLASFFSFLSLFVAIFSLYRTQLSASESGLWTMFSLLFSDFEVVVAYWKSFAFSLAERLPLASLIASSGSLFIFAITLKAIDRDVKRYFLSRRGKFKLMS